MKTEKEIRKKLSQISAEIDERGDITIENITNGKMLEKVALAAQIDILLWVLYFQSKKESTVYPKSIEKMILEEFEGHIQPAAKVVDRLIAAGITEEEFVQMQKNFGLDISYVWTIKIMNEFRDAKK